MSFVAAHTNSKKFVECLESVITSSRTSPVVRDRLIDVLGAVAFKLSVQPRGSYMRPKVLLAMILIYIFLSSRFQGVG